MLFPIQKEKQRAALQMEIPRGGHLDATLCFNEECSADCGMFVPASVLHMCRLAEDIHRPLGTCVTRGRSKQSDSSAARGCSAESAAPRRRSTDSRREVVKTSCTGNTEWVRSKRGWDVEGSVDE